jgi:L-malate glycosyltransferase
MKFAILTTKYPKIDNYYRNGFVHQRNLKYLEFGHDCKVFIVDNNCEQNIYTYEGIEVFEGDYNFIKEHLTNWNAERMLVHFINDSHMRLLQEMTFSIPTVVWIHGVEALKWNRRLFNFTSIRFLKYIYVNSIRLKQMKKFILNSNNISFIFVSKWMKNVMETDIGVKVNQYAIIPNVINTNLFNFTSKEPEQRKKILIIRNFDSRKYANDISIKSILQLKEKSFFNELEISIYGQGKYFKSLTRRLGNTENINIYNKFLSQNDIANVHKDYGIFLCPTRQDSQGVSMCEAMSSGLVPITSNNTAIPEFASPKEGYLTDNRPESIVLAIEDLYNNRETFAEKSYNAAHFIKEKCHQNKVINKEIAFIVHGNMKGKQ